jgi:cysteine-rich repeat protein
MRRAFAVVVYVLLVAACGDDATTPSPDAAAAPDAPAADAPAADAAPADAPRADAAVLLSCGNGLLDPPEQCDDGNHAPNDGCTPWCDVEAACNGQAAAPLQPDATVDGDTTVLANVAFSPSCGGSTSAEQIYLVTFYQPAHVTFTTDRPATDFDTVLYVRRACDAESSELACAGAGPKGDTVTLDLAPATYFVFVDGRSGAKGHFQLALSSTPLPTLAAGDACQPDNSTGVCAPGLICASNTCTTLADACTASAQTLTPGTPATGTTIGAIDLANPTCASDGGAGEARWRVDVPAGQRVDLLATAQATAFGTDHLDVVLSLASDCLGGAAATLACADNPTSAQAAESVQQSDIPAGSYYLLVDGYGGAAGAYSLSVRLRPIRAAGEACDPTGQADRCDTGLACTGNPTTCQ